jgi:nitrilase
MTPHQTRSLRIGPLEIDPARVPGERQNFDPAGHYFRRDVFDVTVDRTRQESAEFLDG